MENPMINNKHIRSLDTQQTHHYQVPHACRLSHQRRNGAAARHQDNLYGLCVQQVIQQFSGLSWITLKEREKQHQDSHNQPSVFEKVNCSLQGVKASFECVIIYKGSIKSAQKHSISLPRKTILDCSEAVTKDLSCCSSL